MQTATIPATHKPPPAARKQALASSTAATSTAPATPPVMTAMEPADVTQYPPAIFGKLPAGFTLERQVIQMLAHWHRKAIAEVDEHPSDLLEAEFDAAMGVVRSLYAAILNAKATRPSEISIKLAAVVHKMNQDKSDEIEEHLTGADFRRLAAELAAATQPLYPKKKTGALQRRGKLTRFGLLHRYQAFLIQELETIGWHVYGERDYPMTYRPSDHAVNARCNSPKHSNPFFDGSKLPDRARKVLKSLQIDTRGAFKQ
jgi:hypothetical protein